MKPEPVVTMTMRFPAHLPREVVHDRISLILQGALTFRDAEVVVDSWNAWDHPSIAEAEGERHS